MNGQGGEKNPRGKQLETGPNLYTTLQRKITEALLERKEKAEKQDWWAFSKIWVIISLIFISIPVIVILISGVPSVLRDIGSQTMISLLGALIGLGPYVVPILIIGIMSIVIGIVSVMTDDSEIWIIESKRIRYLVHSCKLIFAGLLVVGYYQFLWQDMYVSFGEFLTVIFGFAGLFLLPFSLILWGLVGLQREKYLE